jgi:23S rRNA (cytidine1920-2'-O)/16S rRNA (cytidine1409-2'-O)-methyltransferase
LDKKTGTPHGSHERQRADVALVERGLVPSRAQAQALILAGRVYVGEERIDKAGQIVRDLQALRVSEGERFVSRGGHKLEGAIVALELEVRGLVCVDVGASTGGFSDCLLQRGARRVFAVDVGENQLAERVRNDARVTLRDRTNARHLRAEDFDEPIDLIVVDASFIGIEKLLPALFRSLPVGGLLLALIKPQFEAGKRDAARAKGVIRDPVLRERLLEEARKQVAAQGFELLGSVDSSLAGPKGNVEHFVYARRLAGSGQVDDGDAGERAPASG